MNDALLYGMAVGIAAFGLIFVALDRRSHTQSQRKALGIASGAIGFGVCWWFYRHPYEIERIMETISGKAIGIILAAMGVALIYWKLK